MARQSATLTGCADGVIDLQCFLSSGGVSPLVVRPGHRHLRRLALRFRGCRPGPLTPGAADIFMNIFDYDFDAISCGLTMFLDHAWIPSLEQGLV